MARRTCTRTVVLVLLACCAMPRVACAGPVRCTSPVALFEAMQRGEYEGLDEVSASCSSTEAALRTAIRSAARLDTAHALSAIDRYRRKGDRDPGRALIALSVEADAAFAGGLYGRAARAAAEQADLLAAAGRRDEEAEARQTAAVARLLAGQPSQRKVAGRSTVVRSNVDAAGLTRVPILVGDRTEPMVVDTGANLSVVSVSAAARLGLRMVEGNATVGSSTRDTVAVKVAIAPRLSVGGLTFANVAFLVMEDSQLSFPGGYAINGIVGLPILLSAGGLTLHRNGTLRLAAPAANAAAATSTLWAKGSDLVVEARVDGRSAALHLDTGANRTSLSARFADRYPKILSQSDRRVVRSGGAGGISVTSSAVILSLPIALGSSTTVLSDVEIANGPSSRKPPWLGTLGQDVLRPRAWFGIDLRRMRLLVSS